MLSKLLNNLATLKDIRAIIGPAVKRFYLLTFMMVIASFLEGFGLLTLLPILEIIINKEGSSEIYRLAGSFLTDYSINEQLFFFCSLYLIFQLARFLFISGKVYYQTRIVQDLREKWTSEILTRYLEADINYINRKQSGELMQNAMGEPSKATNLLSLLANYFSFLIASLILYCFLLYTQYKLTLFLSLLFVWTYFLLVKFGSPRQKSIGQKQIKLSQTVNNKVVETFRAIKQIKIFNLTRTSIDSIDELIHQQGLLNIRAVMIAELPKLISSLLIVVVFVVILTYYVLLSDATLTEIMPRLGVFAYISQRLLRNLMALINFRFSLARHLPSMQMVKKIKKEKIRAEKLSEGLPLTALKKDILFQSVSFSYPDSTRVFSRLTLKFPLHKITLVIGRSGIGKTTLVELIMGLLQPTAGSITFNGKNLHHYRLTDLRRMIAYVSQDIYLFYGSIYDNVKIGNPGASDEEIHEALRLAHCDEFIKKMPKGIHTIIDEESVNLSGGQKQRIAIARAIVRKPELYIFDEATSSLDTRSEKLIYDSIQKISKKSTIIVITHRLSFMKKADVIYDLEKLIGSHRTK